MQATAKDLRFHSRELLNVVSRGEEVIITYRGQPCAKLVPLKSTEDQEQSDVDNELFGLWRDHETVADVDGYVRGLRKGRILMLIDTDMLVWYMRGNENARLVIEENPDLSHSVQLADALIGATAEEHGLTLLTGNAKHYKPLKGAKTVRFTPSPPQSK